VGERQIEKPEDKVLSSPTGIWATKGMASYQGTIEVGDPKISVCKLLKQVLESK